MSRREEGGEDVESAQLLGNREGKQEGPSRRGPSAVQRHPSSTNLQPAEGEGMPEYTLPQCLVRAWIKFLESP